MTEAETFAAANQDLDNMGNALLEGANMAPRMTIDTIIRLEAVAKRWSYVSGWRSPSSAWWLVL